MGDSTRGAGAPLCVVVGEGSTGEGPHRKGPSPVRAFAYFSHEGKVGRGPGAEPPKKEAWCSAGHHIKSDNPTMRFKKPPWGYRSYSVVKCFVHLSWVPSRG